MIEAFSIPSVYAAEAALMATLPEGDLMARAVAGLTEVVSIRLAGRRSRSVVALVGPGNNGADALYAVSRLADEGHRAGAVVVRGMVHAQALAAATSAGVTVVEDVSVDGHSTAAALALIGGADVVLDGIVGIGGRSGLPTFALAWVAGIPESAYVVAVDLPSGQDPAGHRGDPDGVFADETVTFSVPKPVHLMPATEPACGLLTVVDIGFEVTSEPPTVCRLERDDVAMRWPMPGAGDDKYSRGVLGVVAGGENYTGAAILTVTAAVNAGAGMVRYVGTPTPEALVRAAVPEAVHGSGQVQAWVIGPGLDITSRRAGAAASLRVAREALASDLPVVIDAGGLDLVDGPRDAPTLLTPHAGECARLLSRLTGTDVPRASVSADSLTHARALADRTGSTVLLKGSWTLVVPPGGATAYSQNDAPAWLATAGAGDVLAGLVGMLLAAGLEPVDAGALGALVHGLAADDTNPGGPVRALAVAQHLPVTIAALLRRR